MKLLPHKQSGFSLTTVLIAIGLVGGLSLTIMKLFDNIQQAKNFAEHTYDFQSLKSEVRMLINEEKFCRVSLAGNGPYGNPSTPVTFKKSNIDENNEGLDIELWLSDQGGENRTIKKLSANDPDKNKFESLKITSMKVKFDNGVGFDYTQSASHTDIAKLEVEVEKRVGHNNFRKLKFSVDINVNLATGSTGLSKIISCARKSEFKELRCYTLRRYEKIDYRNKFVGPNGELTDTKNGLNFLDVVSLHGGCCAGSATSGTIPNDALVSNSLSLDLNNTSTDGWGFKCRADRNFFMMSCGHASKYDNEDNDLTMTENGCFAGNNDGDRFRNVLDMRCCRYE